MSRPLYAIPILNELHELYPDLLYHPSRFQCGNDVITYIVDRGIRRSFREESLQYHRRLAQTQAQSVRVNSLHSASRIDDFDMILHGGRIAPRIYPSPAPSPAPAPVPAPVPAANASVSAPLNPSANEFISLLPPSPIDHLLSYFIRESMDGDFSMASPLRPSEEQLQAHTTVHTLTENSEANCAICQDVMVVGQTTRRLSCQHAFHLSCVDAWFSSRPTCPTCRHDVRLA